MSLAVECENGRIAVPARMAFQRPALALALLAAAAVAVRIEQPRLILLFAIGLLLGLTLYHAAFGFASAYRRLIVLRDGGGVQAHLLLLGLTTLLFAPALAGGSAFGQPLTGAIAPAGWSVAAGALLFGVGMQLGGGCGSGTLYTIGGGSPRMVVTLVAFCAGSFWASLHMDFWQALPGLDAMSLGEALGWPRALLLQGAALLTLSVLLRKFAPSQQGLAATPGPGGLLRWLYGPWSLAAGAVLLALLNLATLLSAGHPWTITWAFTLWGAKTATAAGWDSASSGFWQAGFQQQALNHGILSDVTSVMDIGIVLGALAAACLAGRFRPDFRVPRRALLAAVVGGLMMGYGARIAYGCNIGAFVSGIASTSLHGWLWIMAALAGSWVGVRLRPSFGLPD